jgi:hypothetical protein
VTRIPPLSEQLQFARNTTTGRVHILVAKGPGRYWVPLTRSPEHPGADLMMGLLTNPCRMLCGAKFLVGATDQFPAVRTGGGFDDDDLCIACVQALGDQSWRAFHADNRTQYSED